MKIIITLLLKQFVATALVFFIHSLVLIFLQAKITPFLLNIYTINFLLTTFCLMVVYYIHTKAPEFVGFSYLFLVLFKMALVVAVLYNSKEYQKNIIGFMFSYFISLFIEVYLLINDIFKKSTNDF